MIYEHYFTLQQRPFSIAPNPSFLYTCGQYQEALAALEYGMLHRGGFVLLTGEVGTGKTTLCKYLLQEVPQDTELALILHPQLDRLELLQLICKEFGIAVNENAKESQLIDQLTEFLLSVYSKGGYSVLIIDEAQHLDEAVLELVRLLTNLETHEDKLLQIILLGQPELRDRLNRYELRQLNQRFTARYHLNGLSFMQTQSYLQHRIKVAGGKEALFSMSSIWLLHRLTSGIPRLINVMADRCLMGCYAEQKRQVSVAMVWKASKEVLSHHPRKRSGWFSVKAVLASMMLAVGIIAYTQPNLISDFSFDIQDSVVSIQSENQKSQPDNSNQVEVFNPCGNHDNCWYGTLPVSIIKQGLLSGDAWLNNSWQALQHVNHQSGQLPVAITSVPNGLQNSLIKPFESHTLIPWVREVLENVIDASRIQSDVSGWQVIAPDKSVVSSTQVYDVVLHDMVMLFQREHGLLVDGILGPQTLISLSGLDQSMEMVAQ